MHEGTKVWDVVVRVVHWSLVALFVLCYLSAEGLDSLHAILGYGIINQ